jgi:hypothetical protein
MKSQICTVTNKTQLLVAVGCAIGFYGKTEIILSRKDRISTYVLDAKINYEDYGSSNWWIQYFKDRYDRKLKRVRSNIRRIPAEYFKGE